LNPPAGCDARSGLLIPSESVIDRQKRNWSASDSKAARAEIANFARDV
jgi:hypothetical protein